MYTVKKRDLQAICRMAVTMIDEHDRKTYPVYFWSQDRSLFVGVRAERASLRIRLSHGAHVQPTTVDAMELRAAVRNARGVDEVHLNFRPDALLVESGNVTAIPTRIVAEVPPIIAANIDWKPEQRCHLDGAIISALANVHRYIGEERFQPHFQNALMRITDRSTLIIAGDGAMFAMYEFPSQAIKGDFLLDKDASALVLPELTDAGTMAAQSGISTIETGRLVYRYQTVDGMKSYPDATKFLDRPNPIQIVASCEDLRHGTEAAIIAYVPHRHENRVAYVDLKIDSENSCLTMESGRQASVKASRVIRLREQIVLDKHVLTFTCSATRFFEAMKFCRSEYVSLGFASCNSPVVIRPIEKEQFKRAALVAPAKGEQN